jgi:YVTN family beta-propeller protein
MNLRICGPLAITAFAVSCILGSVQSLAQDAYIANGLSDNVTVIDTRTNTVVDPPITVGDFPWGVAVAPDGKKVYVANINSGTVSVIDARTNTVAASFPVGSNPYGVAVSPDSRRVYVANDNIPATVTVIDAASGATTATILLGDSNAAASVAVSPDGSKVYALILSGEIAAAVIDIATNAVDGTISTPGTFNAYQAAFSPDGTRAYISQTRFSTPTAPVLTVVDVATNAVVDTVVLGSTDGAGGALGNNVAKCQLVPLNPAQYSVSFTAEEIAQLKAIFPQGVCNYSMPGVGQRPTEGTWQFF